MPEWPILDQVVRGALRETGVEATFEWEQTTLAIRCPHKTLKVPFSDSELEDPHAAKMKLVDLLLRECEEGYR